MPDLKISPYAPLTLIGVKTRKLYSLEVAQTGKGLLAKALPNGSSGNLYFPETGHNLAGPFRSYWQQHGGLLVYSVTGSGFLHHMVRNLVGTFVDAGRGHIDPASIPEILAARLYQGK